MEYQVLLIGTTDIHSGSQDLLSPTYSCPEPIQGRATRLGERHQKAAEERSNQKCAEGYFRPTIAASQKARDRSWALIASLPKENNDSTLLQVNPF